VLGGVPQCQHAAHRVAEQHGGSADDLVDEAAQHGQVGAEPAAAGGNAAAAVPEQVDGEHPAGGGEQRGEQPPVERRAAEAVDGQHDRGAVRSAEVEVVHRPAEVRRV
jgi:hypothetical protein